MTCTGGRRGRFADLAPYDDDLLAGELAVFLDKCLPEVMGAPLDDAARAAFLAAWRPLFQVARAVPTHLVLRDYHVDNLMVWKDGLAWPPAVC